MKTLVTAVAAGLLAVSFAATSYAATATTTKSDARQRIAQKETACKAEAAKKVSAIHFMKRQALIDQCMGRTAHAKVVKTPKVKAVKMEKKTPASTTGQAIKESK